MKKMNLKTFVNQKSVFIQDESKVELLTSQLWEIPFLEIYGGNWDGCKTSPWKFMYEELTFMNLIDCSFEEFSKLTFGEVLFLAWHYVDTDLKNVERRKEPSYVLAILSKMYFSFNF